MKKIMIVDDSVIIRQRLKELFKNKGFEVVGEVESGEKALVKFRECKPDIVTMDIALPGMNGIEAVEKLIEIDPDVKVIMLTGMGERTMVLKAIKLGAVHFIVKPFQEAKVMEVINEVIGISPNEEEQNEQEQNGEEEKIDNTEQGQENSIENSEGAIPNNTEEDNNPVED